MFWSKKRSRSSSAQKGSRPGSKPAAAPPDGEATAALAAAPAITIPGIEDLIRTRAYQLFLERGGRDGSAEQDWLRAEAEVRAGRII